MVDRVLVEIVLVPVKVVELLLVQVHRVVTGNVNGDIVGLERFGILFQEGRKDLLKISDDQLDAPVLKGSLCIVDLDHPGALGKERQQLRNMLDGRTGEKVIRRRQKLGDFVQVPVRKVDVPDLVDVACLFVKFNLVFFPHPHIDAKTDQPFQVFYRWRFVLAFLIVEFCHKFIIDRSLGELLQLQDFVLLERGGIYADIISVAVQMMADHTVIIR